jgi:serine protease Do
VTDEIAESLAMDSAQGALIAGVTEKGPAEEAGIQPGDIIVEFDGRPVLAMHELPRMVADQPIGKEVQVMLLRNGERQEIIVTLGRLEDAEKEISALDTEDTAPEPAMPVISDPLGLTLADLTPELRTEFKVKAEIEGVLVTNVADGSIAADKRIKPGDVIVAISQEPVATSDEVEARIEALKQDGRKSALFLLANSNGDKRFVAIGIAE